MEEGISQTGEHLEQQVKNTLLSANDVLPSPESAASSVRNRPYHEAAEKQSIQFKRQLQDFGAHANELSPRRLIGFTTNSRRPTGRRPRHRRLGLPITEEGPRRMSRRPLRASPRNKGGTAGFQEEKISSPYVIFPSRAGQ